LVNPRSEIFLSCECARRAGPALLVLDLARQAKRFAPEVLELLDGHLGRQRVSWLNFKAGVTRANAGVLPLSTDGTARLAAAASLARPGAVDLLVDVSGYFASPAGGPPAALELQARLCPAFSTWSWRSDMRSAKS